MSRQNNSGNEHLQRLYGGAVPVTVNVFDASTQQNGGTIMMKSHTALGRAALLAVICALTASAQQPTSRQVSNMLEHGYQLLKQNRRTEALTAFNKVIAQEPENHAALIELGYLHAGFKHWRSAAKYLSAASEQDPQNQRLHMDLGYAYQAMKEYSKAENEFDTVAKEPGEFQVQAQSALVDAQNAKQTPKSDKQARLMKQGYQALSGGNKALARQRFEAVLAEDPQNTAALKQLGFLDLSQGKVNSAEHRFETARAADASDYFAALQLGYIYQRQRKTSQAQEAFNAALASSDPQVHGAAQAALVSTGETGASSGEGASVLTPASGELKEQPKSE